MKFRQGSNHGTKVLEAAKLTYFEKTKKSITFHKFGSHDFWWIANSLFNKVNLLYLLHLTDLRCCLLLLKKWNCLQRTFLRTHVLMNWVSLYLCFLFMTNPKLHQIHVTSQLAKGHNQLWFVKNIWSWLYSCGDSGELWAWTFIHTSWTLQYMSEGILFFIVGRSHLPLYLRMLARGLWLKTAVLSVFEKLVNNGLVDLLKKCDLCLISSMVPSLLDQL